MKRWFIFACMLVLAFGCASGAKKSFTLIVDPPDADITVIPGGGGSEQKYHSPADISVRIPQDPIEAAKGRLVIKRDAYRPMTIILNSVQSDTMRIRMSKIQYRLKLRLTHPKPSDDLSYRDRVLAVRLIPEERNFTVKIQNLADKPLHILWDKSEYDDYSNRPHRILLPEVKPEKRDRPIPAQEIRAGESLVQTFMPDDLATYSREKKAWDSKPLFPLNSDSALGLKGKSFLVTLPVEIDRAIIPDYIFQFDIIDVVKE